MAAYLHDTWSLHVHHDNTQLKVPPLYSANKCNGSIDGIDESSDVCWRRGKPGPIYIYVCTVRIQCLRIAIKITSCAPRSYQRHVQWSLQLMPHASHLCIGSAMIAAADATYITFVHIGMQWSQQLMPHASHLCIGSAIIIIPLIYVYIFNFIIRCKGK